MVNTSRSKERWAFARTSQCNILEQKEFSCGSKSKSVQLLYLDFFFCVMVKDLLKSCDLWALCMSFHSSHSKTAICLPLHPTSNGFSPLSKPIPRFVSQYLFFTHKLPLDFLTLRQIPFCFPKASFLFKSPAGQMSGAPQVGKIPPPRETLRCCLQQHCWSNASAALHSQCLGINLAHNIYRFIWRSIL